MQGSWSLETTVLKPLLLGYTLQLLTRYNGDRFSNGCGQVFLSVKGSTHIEVTGPISLPTKQALHGAKGGSVVSTAILTPQSFLPSEYEQSEWDWHGLVRRGGLIIHTLRIENSSGRL
jgi:hypothetical protein